MKTVIVILVLAFVAAPASGQQGRWAAPDDPTVKTIVAMERMWGASNCAPQPGLKDVFADEFQGTSPTGSRFNKAVAIETDTNNLHRECKLGEVKVQLFGDSVAVVYGDESSIAKGKDGKDFKRCLVWTDTLLKRNGRWQIVAAHDTQVTCK